MDMIIYPLILLGSFSTGYSLLRVGFPKKQELSYLEKGAYGLIFGVITFAPAIYVGIQIGISGFFITAILAYLLFFSILYTKRFFLHETDSVELIKETKSKERIPLSVLTNEEKEEYLKKDKENNPTENKPTLLKNSPNIADQPKREIFKEKEDNLVDSIQIKTKQKKDNNESEEEKKKILASLRIFGKQISKKEEKKEIIKEEDELEELEEEEEEY